MTTKHLFKAWIARIRWYVRTVKAAMRFTDEYKDYKKLIDLRNEIYHKHLIEQRTNPAKTGKDYYTTEGKLEILNLLLDERDRQTR